VTNRKLKQQLHEAFEHASPKTLPQDVFEACVPGKETATPRKRTVALWRPLVAVAAVLALVLTGILLWPERAVPTASMKVSLDVNPSILLEIDDSENIVAVNALNEDGSVLVGKDEWAGTTVDATVGALVQAMVQEGYLNDNANSVLISVDGTDATRAASLEQKLAAEVQTLLADGGFEGAVLSQTLSADDALRQQADAYGISYGKATLIRHLLGLDPLKTFEELAALSINDLNLLCNTTAMPGIHASGNASDKSYIAKETATQTALTHAALTAEQVAMLKTEFDCEDGVMCYEVEFVYNGTEYEYEIDATTGEILKTESEAEESDDEDDPDDVFPESEQAYIAPDAVKTIVLTHAGVDETAVIQYDCEEDVENGAAVYEIEFRCGDTEFEYCVDAVTGEVLSAQTEDDRD